ncbi:MAG TPA: hypothetical protein PKY82_23140, partial [Pyrinomonadaceae bacterium]|nr:hypothetical protein [Pyrinomonadaceae bacterium]
PYNWNGQTYNGAGTGMKYYRNVEVAFDPTVNQKEEREDEFIPIITGGMDMPEASMDVPGVDADLDGFSIEEGMDDSYLDETEESFEMEEISDDVLADGFDDDDF